jgi:hypothetical protein
VVARLGSLCHRMVERWRRVELAADAEAAPVLALPISALKTISSVRSMIVADLPFVAAGRGLQQPCRGGTAATSRLNRGNTCR